MFVTSEFNVCDRKIPKSGVKTYDLGKNLRKIPKSSIKICDLGKNLRNNLYICHEMLNINGMNNFIGREPELDELRRAVNSHNSEFVLLYGRRRVGKTYLVRQFFEDKFTFKYVGKHRVSMQLQLSGFRDALAFYGNMDNIPELLNWSQAFLELGKLLDRDSSKRKVIFFDEMPWLDVKGSDFVSGFEYFWNSWVSFRNDIVFIACGSATTWMHEKLEVNRGGLHNRITKKIALRPFNLHECEMYLKKVGFDWDRYQIMQCYMILGGVPYYLSLLHPELSLHQNIDNLFFRQGATLKCEFEELYNALYGKADSYIAVVRMLASKSEGFTRQEIMDRTKIAGGTLTDILQNLERCDFILSYAHLGMKVKNAVYRLCDFYTLYYFRFLENNNTQDEQYWVHHINDRSIAIWEGFSFELLCLMHLNQIKKGLGISGMATEASVWRFVPNKDDDANGFQIDLVIKRIDKILHLCEMKFSDHRYAIDKRYENLLRERLRTFEEKSGYSRGCVYTFITPAGLVDGIHNGLVHSQITSKELFWE